MTTWRGRRSRRADGNRRYGRNYELDRAVEKLRNAALILILGFAVLGLAFARAWNQ